LENNLSGTLALLLGNPFNHSSHWTILSCAQWDQRSVSFEEDIVFCKVLEQLGLLQVRVQLNLIDNGFVFSDFEKTFKVRNSEIGDTNILGKSCMLSMYL
jgi:hypothetical protein